MIARDDVRRRFGSAVVRDAGGLRQQWRRGTGVAEVVVDGVARDVRQMRGMGFIVYACGG